MKKEIVAFSRNSLSIFLVIPTPVVLWFTARSLARRDEWNVLDRYFLLSLTPMRLERFHLRRERPQQRGTVWGLR